MTYSVTLPSLGQQHIGNFSSEKLAYLICLKNYASLEFPFNYTQL